LTAWVGCLEGVVFDYYRQQRPDNYEPRSAFPGSIASIPALSIARAYLPRSLIQGTRLVWIKSTARILAGDESRGKQRADRSALVLCIFHLSYLLANLEGYYEAARDSSKRAVRANP